MDGKTKDCNGMDLTTEPRAVLVFKKPVVLGFEVAGMETVVQTKEGPVTAKPGDAIMTGTQGERWPIPKDKFAATYDVLGDGKCAKKRIEVLALRMDGPFTVKVSWSAEPLVGKPGDYLVQYGKGDFGIVDAKIFDETYARVKTPEPAAKKAPAVTEKDMEEMRKRARELRLKPPAEPKPPRKARNPA